MQHMPQTPSLTLSNKHCCIFWRKEIPLLWRGILWDSGFQFKSVITHPHPKCCRTLRDVFKFCDIFYVPSQIGNNWACGSWGIGGGLPSSWPEKETHWLVSRPGSVLAFLCGCLPFKPNHLYSVAFACLLVLINLSKLSLRVGFSFYHHDMILLHAR